jgi:hypothetical protein
MAKVMHKSFDKNVFSYIFGDFFTNPSGHPAHNPSEEDRRGILIN